MPMGMRLALRAAIPVVAAFGLLATLDRPHASAQTIRPVIAEYQLKARGRFELVNDTLVPLNVVLEPKSFSLAEDGTPTFRPLDSGIRLKLSSMSFRIPPQQTYYVFYEASADQYPAWFTVYATFAGLPQQAGLNVQIELPHTVYLVQKEPLEKSTVHVREAKFLRGSQRVQVELENTSDRLGRVLRVEVAGRGSRNFHPGFPLMPRSRRRVEIEWVRAEAPEHLRIQFNRFEVEERLE